MQFTENQDVRMSRQIAPLIDVVFLLLIYFMVTATILRKEGDIAFSLPLPDRSPIPDVPIEAHVSIADDGAVFMDGLVFGRDDRELKALVAHVSTLRQLAEAQQAVFFVTLDPDRDALHHRVMDVIDACRDARVRHLAFAREQT